MEGKGASGVRGERSMEANTVLRWIRALTLASVLLGSGVAGHVAAGGFAPAASVLLPLFVLLAAALVPLLNAPATPRRVTALLVVGQGVLHVLLQFLGGSTAVEVAGRSTVTPGTVAADPLATHLAHGGSSTPTEYSLMFVTGDHLVMLVAHVAAALVVGLWLAAGERAAWRLVAIAALPVVGAWITLRELSGTAAVALVVTRPAAALPCWSRESATRSSSWAGRGVSRRGPPRPIAA
jgi:hypothetical protein